jgi:hypothetical protein
MEGITWLFKIPMGTSKDFFEIYRRFGPKGSPIEDVVGIHITVWLEYCVDQGMIIPVFEEHSECLPTPSKDGGSIL